ncbi:MAG TPA: nodulation protein NfeD, partial [Oleiagrimonas sp.]|nr:nodulation protein NfeD [Oleiagrimonas sp.]
INLDGAIGPAAAEYVHDASARAVDDGARAIILRLDTPGGLSRSMHDIIDDILASPIPVLGYVAPSGARAASAGTYILYACHVAAMAPATHLGAATPVSLGGHTPMPAPAASSSTADKDTSASGGGAEAHKVLNDAIAYIRSLAQLRERNADWAEQAVRGAATLTAREALSRHVIDLMAANTDSLLTQASGRTAMVDHHEVTLQLEGLPVHTYAPDWRTRFLAVITNPTIAYLLLMAGIWGLILEAFHPGILWPGITGAICLLVGLYALQMLPVNYIGLALMALGVGLLIAEVVVPTFGALGIGGIIAFVVGSIMLMDTGVPGYSVNLGVIGGIALCGIALLALTVWMLMRARKARVVSGEQQMLDASGELLEAVDAGGEGWAMVYGERWRIRSDIALPAGTHVHVTRREGLILWVAPSMPHHD